MKEGLPIITCNQRSKNKLHHVKQDPYRKKCPYRHLKSSNNFLVRELCNLCPLPAPLISPSRSWKSPLTSKQYPNSNCSPSPTWVKRPCCLLRPGSPAIPGPSNRPTKKYAAVATRSEMARKWTKTNKRVSRTVASIDVVDAIPHAIPVKNMKKASR